MKNITYINAGAGSGKTYTLTEKMCELITQKKSKQRGFLCGAESRRNLKH